MANRSGLGILGGIFGCVTVAVALIAATVVFAHVDGSLDVDAPSPVIAQLR